MAGKDNGQQRLPLLCFYLLDGKIPGSGYQRKTISGLIPGKYRIDGIAALVRMGWMIMKAANRRFDLE